MPQRSTPRSTRRHMGRPSLLGEPAETITAYLPQSTIRQLRRMGEGSLSAGIRRAALLCQNIPTDLLRQLNEQMDDAAMVD